jgi:hypothetical protein
LAAEDDDKTVAKQKPEHIQILEDFISAAEIALAVRNLLLSVGGLPKAEMRKTAQEVIDAWAEALERLE